VSVGEGGREGGREVVGSEGGGQEERGGEMDDGERDPLWFDVLM